MYHLFFEQSGTFKNEFKKLGFKAEDYDILNDFNETDHVIDLYKEIKNAYRNKKSVFDNINPETDQIIAFFPCIRFEVQIIMKFKGTSFEQTKWSDLKKLEYDLKLHRELSDLYSIITKFVIVCLRKKIPLVIENPYCTQHYLTRYWCIEPAILDLDRKFTGDYYKKPTQYFFINRKPANNFIFESADPKPRKAIIEERTIERSMISPDYANRFIREYILTKEELDQCQN